MGNVIKIKTAQSARQLPQVSEKVYFVVAALFVHDKSRCPEDICKLRNIVKCFKKNGIGKLQRKQGFDNAYIVAPA